MQFLLDTHALIWAAISPEKLSRKAARIIESLDADILVSAASAWEIATKVRIGKLPGAEAFALEFAARIEAMGFTPLAISVEHAQRAGLLPGGHRDPFDRMLIAQAHSENAAIVSCEELFDGFGVRRVW